MNQTQISLSKISLFIILIFLASIIQALPIVDNPLIRSAVLPGWGQLTIDKQYGYAMLTSEVLFWSTYIYHTTEQDLRDRESYEYALKFAQVNPGKYSDQYYRDLSRYSSSGFDVGGYNLMVRQTALSMTSLTPEQQQAYIDEHSIPDEMSWNWENDNYRKKYSTMRKNILELKDRAKVISGLIMANHLISSIDILRQRKHWKNVHPSLQYYRNTPILNLNIEF